MYKSILLLYVSWSLSFAHHIYINEANGKDNPLCFEAEETTPCMSIGYVARYLKLQASTGTVIHVVGTVKVDSLVHFNGLESFSIIGTNFSRLTCVASVNSTDKCHVDNCFDSGLWFSKIRSLVIFGLDIVGCGVRRVTADVVANTGIAITDSIDVAMCNITISYSSATSLLIYNISGNVLLESIIVSNNVNSSFTLVSADTSYTRGIQIILNSHIRCTLSVRNCTFLNITTPRYTKHELHTFHDYDDLGKGGGCSLWLNSYNNNLLVEDCTFEMNQAPRGSGMYLKVQHSLNNTIVIKHSVFRQCTAAFAGGGLLIAIALLRRHLDLPSSGVQDMQNDIIISECQFSHNKAEYGAGTNIFAYFSDSVLTLSDHICFFNCTWKENISRYSPAVNISPKGFKLLGTGLLPSPRFRDCTFADNKMIIAIQKHDNLFVTSGIFAVNCFTVHFAGIILFESNNSTALLIDSGRAIFEANSSVSFVNNTSVRAGGAIALHGSSFLVFNDNSHFEFTSNSAKLYGGAIYYYTINHAYARECFLLYGGNTSILQRNLTLTFLYNTAVIAGSSIYTSSLHFCYYAYIGSVERHGVQEFLSKVGHFSFNGTNVSNIEPNVIATSGDAFKSEDFHLYAIPGESLVIPIVMHDELNQIVKTEFIVGIETQGQVSLHTHDPYDHGYTMNKTVTLFGAPNNTAKLTITSLGSYRRIEHIFDVTLFPCPPGFYLKIDVCSCSADNESEAFHGISKCNHNFTAVLTHGFWAGTVYHNDTKLYTAPCPFHFCLNKDSLPQNHTQLSQYVCGKERDSMLCGRCKYNHSTFFHSNNFECMKNNKCSYGFVFFLLSEILPVFMLVTLIVMFNISFSSGSRNGFVLFSQAIGILPLNLSQFNFVSVPWLLENGHQLFYGIFNFKVFSIEHLSFCLFQEATVMDVLVIKYVTALFAFMLVILITLCLNHCLWCDRLCKMISKRMKRDVSVLNGLSACLMISYTELVRVTFFVMRRVTLLGPGGVTGPTVTFYGGLDYMGGEHLRYAIPAILIFVTVGLFPPLLLLLYPSGLRVLKLCRLNEHCCVVFILRVSRINKLLPMFDVFQGTFKDNFRFFAGVYFLYRIVLLLPYLLYQSFLGYVNMLEILLLLILWTHTTFQPYKLRKHNVIDGLLFGNLAMINGLSILAVHSNGQGHSVITLYFIIYLQLFLIYMPILVLVAVLLHKILPYVKRLLCLRKSHTNEYASYENIDDSFNSIDRRLDPVD